MNFDVISPETTDELLEVIAQKQGDKFRFGAGGTDLLLELKKQPVEGMTIVNLARLNDDRFTAVDNTGDDVWIGALVTADNIAGNVVLQREFPVLTEAARKLASRQIRHVATVGGNLCTASPAGDIATALVALKTRCEILSATGNVRVVPIDEFFTGVRQTVLKKDEILRGVLIEKNIEDCKLHSDFIKIGIRRSMECAVVSLAYHFQCDRDDTIRKAGAAIGSVAPTIKFTGAACEFLIDRKFSSIDSFAAEQFAAKVSEYASPISDIRASAWYREMVLFNISKSIFENE